MATTPSSGPALDHLEPPRGSLGHRALLALVVAAVFGRMLGHDFLSWDDDIHIVQNAQLRPPSWERVGAFWTAPFKALYAPLAYTYWSALTYLTSAGTGPGEPISPAPFAAGQLVWHALTVTLVYDLLRRVASSAHASSAKGALLGALLFAVHPLQVEAVAWMSEARGLISAAFSIGALLLFLRWRDATGGGRGSGLLCWAAGTACLLLALFGKPVAVIVPALGLWLARARGDSWRTAIIASAPWFAIAAAFAWGASQLQGHGGQGDGVSPLGRGLVMLDAFGYYAAKLVWPFGLAPDHGRTPQWVLGGGWKQGYAIPGALLMLAGALSLARSAAQGSAQDSTRGRRRAWLPIALSWTALVPVLGLISFDHQIISTVADRYAYLPMLGPALGVAWLVSRPGAAGRTASLGCAVAVLLLASLSFRQVGHWASTEALFEHNLAVRPDSVQANMQVGALREARHDFTGALGHYEAALGRDPAHAKAWTNIGNVRFAFGDLGGARSAYDRSLELRPHGKVARMNTKRLNRRTKEWTEAAAAEQPGIDAGDARAFKRRGDAMHELGRLTDAVENYERALEGRPEWSVARLDLAWILAFGSGAGVGDPDRALALTAELTGPRSLWIRAQAFAAQGAQTEAAEHVSLAVEATERADNRELLTRIRGWRAGFERGELPPGLRP